MHERSGADVDVEWRLLMVETSSTGKKKDAYHCCFDRAESNAAVMEDRPRFSSAYVDPMWRCHASGETLTASVMPGYSNNATMNAPGWVEDCTPTGSSALRKSIGGCDLVDRSTDGAQKKAGTRYKV